VLELEVKGPAALQREGVADPGALRIAAIVPSFRRGSGGHRTIVRILDELARRGHTVSAWLEDGEGRHAQEPADVTKRSFEQFFAAERVPLEVSWEHWTGADVVLATGWQTVARALLLPRCRGRAYLVQDHEPEFYGTSAEALWAAESYRRGLHCIAASEWLAGLLRSRYGASASHFDLGVEPSEYRAIAGARREDLVVFYARAVTPRRAVPLGMLGLEELARRRPGVEIALYGEDRGLRASFPYRDAGVLDASDLAGLYAQATVGMVLSLTNPSLVNLEMMACGLPCVELASESMLGTFGDGGPLQLSAPEPLALCAAIETLLDDPARRRSLASEGIALAGRRGWPRAAEQVEEGLRLACGVGPSAPEPA
jgi:glycosyltransferase involved in cell wall biosynthesis